MDNSAVIERCAGFLNSMREISDPGHIACQIYARTPLTEPIAALADRVARGDVDRAPITLTLGSASDATFDVRGTHAYGTLATRDGNNFGAIALVLLTIALAVVALVLFRSN